MLAQVTLSHPRSAMLELSATMESPQRLVPLQDSTAHLPPTGHSGVHSDFTRMPVEPVTVRSAQLVSSAWMDPPLNVDKDTTVRTMSRTLFENSDDNLLTSLELLLACILLTVFKGKISVDGAKWL